MISYKKLFVFGDSYADKNSTGEYVGWPSLLESYYKVTNFALSGSSPDHQLTLLLDIIAANNYSKFTDTAVIFLISSPNRFIFDFYNNPGDHHLSIHLSLSKITDASYYDELKPYLKYKNFIFDFYRYYGSTDIIQRTQLLKIVSVLNLYSTLFDQILIWPIFDNLSHNLPQMSSNLTFIPTPLFDIEGNKYGNNDIRLNHLIKENHHIMVSQLIEWIETKKTIDVEKFIWTT